MNLLKELSTIKIASKRYRGCHIITSTPTTVYSPGRYFVYVNIYEHQHDTNQKTYTMNTKEWIYTVSDPEMIVRPCLTKLVKLYSLPSFSIEALYMKDVDDLDLTYYMAIGLIEHITKDKAEILEILSEDPEVLKLYQVLCGLEDGTN